MKNGKWTVFVFLFVFAVLAGILTFRVRSGVRRAETNPLPTETAEQRESDPGSAEAEPTEEPSPLPAAPAEPALPPLPEALREIAICESSLDEELFREAEHKGTVSLVQYMTRDYVSDEDIPTTKDMAVYLPWGYDETQQYDVLILLHCAWADHRFWLVQNREYRLADDSILPVSVPNMLDRMIEEGYCRPLIVVSPCVYLYDHQPSVAGNGYDYTQFQTEIGADLLPYLAEHYATWAEDGSREALRDAREHFGVLGASFGAYASYISVIGDNFDLIAWYTFCGGGEIDPGYLLNCWARTGTDGLPLRCLYISEGEYDDRAGPEISYHNLLRTGGPFREDNVRFTLIYGWGHEDHSYLVGLFNTLQVFFRDTPEGAEGA
ncbi:MAG: hypothetical protein IJQ02_12130 [Oscillospiraceae bacterium]|nr:hypothetical protein [Oscillospiraceae bacterium]